MQDGVSDAELVERAEKGDPRAFEMLVERHWEFVLAAAYCVLGNVDAARDCAQDTFMEAAGKLSSLTQKSKFSAWIWGLSKCKARRMVLRQSRGLM